MSDQGSEPGGASNPIVAQRCTIVVPSTAEFDSRTFRIASSLSTRGHAVTVIGRQAPGLPDDERHPSGYRVVRVRVEAVDGLPGPLRVIVRRLRQSSRNVSPERVGEASATEFRPRRPAAASGR